MVIEAFRRLSARDDIPPIKKGRSHLQASFGNVSRYLLSYEPDSSSVFSAGKPQSSRAATTSATAKASPPVTVTDLSSASISKFATPGSDCNVEVTVARHPPQCMEGQVNFTRTAAAAEPSSVAAGAAAVLDGASGSAQPAATPSIMHSMYFCIVDSCQKNRCPAKQLTVSLL